MPLTVNTNVASLAAQRSMISTNSALETSFERLATGKRINSAADDAAGLAISNTLTAAVEGLNQGVRNAQDGVSMAQIADGAMAEIEGLMLRMRELSVQANNGVLATAELGYIKSEIDAAVVQVGKIISTTEFAGSNLFNSDGNITIQVGSETTDTVAFTRTSTTTTTLKINALDVTAAAAVTAGVAYDIAQIDLGLAVLNGQRAQAGADQAAFESAIRNGMNRAENTAAALSRISDTDYAAETANLTKNQILQQASTSILAQANQQPQSVLALLQ